MKPLLFLCMLLSMAFAGFGQQGEIALFDADRKPVAYIDMNDPDKPIYLWDGKPVAYLQKDGRLFLVYGFNGKFLGWFLRDVLIDRRGDIIGATKRAMPVTPYEPFKKMKQFKPAKSLREVAPYMPFVSDSWSRDNFEDFLLQGISQE